MLGSGEEGKGKREKIYSLGNLLSFSIIFSATVLCIDLWTACLEIESGN